MEMIFPFISGYGLPRQMIFDGESVLSMALYPLRNPRRECLHPFIPIATVAFFLDSIKAEVKTLRIRPTDTGDDC